MGVGGSAEYLKYKGSLSMSSPGTGLRMADDGREKLGHVSDRRPRERDDAILLVGLAWKREEAQED